MRSGSDPGSPNYLDKVIGQVSSSLAKLGTVLSPVTHNSAFNSQQPLHEDNQRFTYLLGSSKMVLLVWDVLLRINLV